LDTAAIYSDLIAVPGGAGEAREAGVQSRAVGVVVAAHPLGALTGWRTDPVSAQVCAITVGVVFALRGAGAFVSAKVLGGDQLRRLVDLTVAIVIEPITKLPDLGGRRRGAPVLAAVFSASIEIDPTRLTEIDHAGAVDTLGDAVGDGVTGLTAGAAMGRVPFEVERLVDLTVAVVVHLVTALEATGADDAVALAAVGGDAVAVVPARFTAADEALAALAVHGGVRRAAAGVAAATTVCRVGEELLPQLGVGVVDEAVAVVIAAITDLLRRNTRLRGEGVGEGGVDPTGVNEARGIRGVTAEAQGGHQPEEAPPWGDHSRGEVL